MNSSFISQTTDQKKIRDHYSMITSRSNSLEVKCPRDIAGYDGLGLAIYNTNFYDPVTITGKTPYYIKIKCKEVKTVFNEKGESDGRVTFIPLSKKHDLSLVNQCLQFEGVSLDEEVIPLDLVAIQNEKINLYFTDENDEMLVFEKPYLICMRFYNI